MDLGKMDPCIESLSDRVVESGSGSVFRCLVTAVQV